MEHFTYHNPTRIIFGEGQIAALDAEIPRDATVLITSGGGSIKRNGVLEEVENALGERKHFVFEGIAQTSRRHAARQIRDSSQSDKGSQQQ